MVVAKTYCPTIIAWNYGKPYFFRTRRDDFSECLNQGAKKLAVMDGCMNGWMDGWIGGRMMEGDGWMEIDFWKGTCHVSIYDRVHQFNIVFLHDATPDNFAVSLVSRFHTN